MKKFFFFLLGTSIFISSCGGGGGSGGSSISLDGGSDDDVYDPEFEKPYVEVLSFDVNPKTLYIGDEVSISFSYDVDDDAEEYALIFVITKDPDSVDLVDVYRRHITQSGVYAQDNEVVYSCGSYWNYGFCSEKSGAFTTFYKNIQYGDTYKKAFFKDLLDHYSGSMIALFLIVEDQINPDNSSYLVFGVCASSVDWFEAEATNCDKKYVKLFLY